MRSISALKQRLTYLPTGMLSIGSSRTLIMSDGKPTSRTNLFAACDEYYGCIDLARRTYVAGFGNGFGYRVWKKVAVERERHLLQSI